MDEPNKPDSNHAQPLSAGPDDHNEQPEDEETNLQLQQPLITSSPEPDCDDDIAVRSQATSATFSVAGENIESSTATAELQLPHADHEEHPSVTFTAATEPVDADDDW
jgi:hypothetical protein